MDNLVFVPVLGILIFVHELGHFMAAKAVGIGVARFSIGLGPFTPLRFQRGDTEYVISWIPFGGYVKMASKEELDELEALEGGRVETPFPPEQLFESKPLAARILVISAGVIMNALFAWLVFSWIYFAYGRAEDPSTAIAEVVREGLPEAAEPLLNVPFGTQIASINGQEVGHWGDVLDAVTDPRSDQLRFEFADGTAPVVLDIPGIELEARIQVSQALVPLWEPRIGKPEKGTPADEAGLREDDVIRRINDQDVRSWGEMVRIVSDSAGRELRLVVERGGETLEISATPAATELKDPESGEERTVGRLGVPAKLDWIRIQYPPLEAVSEGWRGTVRTTVQVLYVLKGLVLGTISFKEVGGPVLIAQATAQAAQIGLEAVLLLTAFLSINLAILNLLPIPVLDGGHLVFLALEGLRGGRPLSRELRQRLTMVGFYFLMLIMLLVLVNDIRRWI